MCVTGKQRQKMIHKTVTGSKPATEKTPDAQSKVCDISNSKDDSSVGETVHAEMN